MPVNVCHKELSLFASKREWKQKKHFTCSSLPVKGASLVHLYLEKPRLFPPPASQPPPPSSLPSPPVPLFVDNVAVFIIFTSKTSPIYYRNTITGPVDRSHNKALRLENMQSTYYL